MVAADHYDVIVIGSGPGGGALAQRLAPTGKRILMLERGGYLPRSRDNWDAKTVFVDGKYQAPDTWYGKSGESFHPGLHYYVGGNSKVYGAALFRLREKDFGALQHVDGISPAWPLGYDVFEPYYCEAESLFHVHGQRGEDPNEPWSSKPYAYPPVMHEPRIQALNDSLVKEGLHPFHLPLGIKLDQNPDGSATTYSPCIRCDAFDGFPCAVNAKADAQVICVDPTLAAHPNFTLLTGAYAETLVTDASGHTVTGVKVLRNGKTEQYSADIVVVACGALSSALLLLRSANDKHPHGLANASGQVGRNYSQAPQAQAGEPDGADRRPAAPARTQPIPGQGHPDQRHRPSGGNLPLRHRPEGIGAEPRLPHARAGQPLHHRRQLLPLHRRREPHADHHRQRPPRRRPHQDAPRLNRLGRTPC